MAGYLEVILGPVFAGKSNTLLTCLSKRQYGGSRIQLFKHAQDKRYSLGEVVSHDGIKMDAVYISTAQELSKQVNPEAQVIGIDEVQFFDDRLVSVCKQLKKTKDILATAVAHDFRGRPFVFRDSQKTVFDLVALADRVSFQHAVCTHKTNATTCGLPASRSQRFINGSLAPEESPTISIGGKPTSQESITYEARCPLHFMTYGD